MVYDRNDPAVKVELSRVALKSKRLGTVGADEAELAWGTPAGAHLVEAVWPPAVCIAAPRPCLRPQALPRPESGFGLAGVYSVFRALPRCLT